MLDFINGKNCTGCKMCGDICPVGAISYKTNKEGFWYPVVDKQLCVNCGLCEERCPEINAKKKMNPEEPKIYSVYSKAGKVRDDSTSGGLFRELAATVLEMGGMVAGCVYSEDYKSSYHTIVDNLDDLSRLMGTKYFQSNTAGIYSKVKKALEEGRAVLFAGTPCHNAALKMFLKQDYDKLYQMDFICNSINSPLAYRKYLEELEQRYKSPLKMIRFKDKKNGWTRLNIRMIFENGKVYEEDKYNSLWGKGLIKHNLFQRECCYECNYRELAHSFADITVGDFWGLEDEDAYNMFKGISIAMINSAKGEELFNKTRSKLFVKRRTTFDVLKGNQRALDNPILHENRKLFFEMLETNPFSVCVKKCTGETGRTDLKWKKEIKRIINYLRDGKISVWNYIYLNYFSKNVIRLSEAKIVPWKNVIFDLATDSQIVLEGYKDIEIGAKKLKGSKAETYIKMRKGAKWRILHGGQINYGVTLDIQRNAVLEMGDTSFNTGSVVIIQKRMKFGEMVRCGRNCMFLDSDFHQIQMQNGTMINPPQEIVVEDHVWFAGNAKVLRGTIVGENCIIGPNVVIKRNIPANSSVSTDGDIRIVNFPGRWSEKANRTYSENLFEGKKQILVGYGKDGKEYYRKQKKYIEIVIDNNLKDDLPITFKEFIRRYPVVDDGYVFVIGSTRYFRELYKMVKKVYPKAKIEMMN